jgi:hypothetical protein
MSSNFTCSYMERNSLTYIPGFSVKFFFQPIYTDSNIFTAWGCQKSNFCRSWLPLRPLSEGSLIIVNKVKRRKQIGKNFCSFLFMLNFGRNNNKFSQFITYLQVVPTETKSSFVCSFCPSIFD